MESLLERWERPAGTRRLVSMRLNLRLVDAVKRLLRAKDRTDAVEQALLEVAEREKFRRFVEKTSGRLKLEGLP